MKVNGRKFRRYQLDNINTILDRIAYDKKTLSKYIFFPDGIPKKDSENILVEDLLQIINKYSKDIIFESLYVEIKDKLEQQNLSLEKDIIPVFLFLNETLSETDDYSMVGALLLAMQEEFDNLGINVDVNDIYKNRDNFIDELQNSKKRLKEKVEKQNELFEQFEQIDEGVSFTSFDLEKANIELELDFENIGIMEIFNQIELNKNIPFATINNFYKIYKEFIPSTEWSLSLENTIILKVLTKNNPSTNLDDYSNVFIFIDKKDDKDKILVGLSLNISGQNISKEEYINRILSIFSSKVNIINEKETKVNGVFYLPLQNMNKFIFADLAMNNPLFSSMMVIDEHTKASKSKDSIYIHFYNEEIGELTASITEKIATRNEADLRKKDKKIFIENKNYIRIKITRAENQESIIMFQNIISKLFVIYNNSEDELIKYYKNFISTFSKTYGQLKKIKEKSDISRKLKLKDIVPELFISGYPKKCVKQPTIIDDYEVENAIKDGYQVMIFPKPDNNFNLEPKNYICEHETHIYPGIRDNPLSNKEQIPFLPCCYEKDQSEKKGSVYRQYFFDEELETKKIIQQDAYITNKILPDNGSGIIPKNLINLFNAIENSPKISYERRGVNRTKNSLLECVIKATQHVDLKRIENIDTFLNEFKENYLSTPEIAALCKQELYDRNINEIIEMINNPEEYFDPQYFLPLLEYYFNCNIFVFYRKYNDAVLKLPRYQQTYYKVKNQNKSIIIIEHLGAPSDHATYPQCELISRIDSSQKYIEYAFEHDSYISENITHIFNQLKQTYKLTQKIPDIIFPISNLTINEQTFDSYGKTRILNVTHKKYNFTIFCNPIAPLPIIENTSPYIHKINYSILLKILPLINFTPIGQIVENNFTKEITGIIGNVSVSIPIENTNTIPNIPILDRSLSYSLEKISKLDTYNYYKKLSRYITEYIYWLYSKYLDEINSDDTESLTNIANFRKKYIKIIPEFKYSQINKNFSMKSSLINDNKLILTSEEILKRIIYVLREFSVRHSRELLNYKNKKSMEGYYIDITDFNNYYNQVILQGNNSIQKWIDEQSNKYIISHKVIPEKRQPYFFQNKLVKDEIFLAQNTDTIEKALYISQQWYENDLNPNNNLPENISNIKLQFMLYSYINENSINKYLVRGKNPDYSVRVIGYKISITNEEDVLEVKNMFTVLLEL
jgi:hypothetical protein